MKFADFLNTLPEVQNKAIKISLTSGETMLIKNIEGKTGSLRLLQGFLGKNEVSTSEFPLQNFCEYYDEWKQNPEGHHTTINFLHKYNRKGGKIEYFHI